MQTLASGYHGVSLIVGLNVDRLLYLATILASLLLGAFIGTI